MKNTGLYIGRFQPFHNGHKNIVDIMLEENEVSIVLIGLSDNIEKNPFDYNTRLHFFTHTYSNSENIFFYPLRDEESDLTWIEHVLSFPEIINSTNLNIYAGDLLHDSAIKTLQEYEYKFQEQEKEINFIEISRKNIPISGTQIREKFLTSGAQSIKNDLPYEVFEYLQGD